MKSLFALLVFLPCGVALLADLPNEQVFLARDRLATSVLVEAQGVFSLLCKAPSPETDDRQEKLRVYSRNLSGFVQVKDLPFVQSKPISGWQYDGCFMRRFPLLGRPEEGFVPIVYDALQGLSGWVKLGELCRCYEQASGQRSYEITLFMDFEERKGQVGISIDLFGFAPNGKQTFYAQPSGDGPGITVGEMDYIQTEKNKSLPEPVRYIGHYFYIVAIKGGYAKVRFFDDSVMEGHPRWIKMRDKEGRLTFWLTFNPGC